MENQGKRAEGTLVVRSLFALARQVSILPDDTDLDRLEGTARAEAANYMTTDSGVKGLIARTEQDWWKGLLLVMGIPYVAAWLINLRDKMLNPTSSDESEDDVFKLE